MVRAISFPTPCSLSFIASGLTKYLKNENESINEKELVKCEQKDGYISLSPDENQYCD